MALRITESIERFPRWQEFRPSALIHKGLPESAKISVRVRWPLYFIPIVVLNQLLTPHPVWIVLFVSLVGLYGAALYWVRAHARHVALDHQRLGDILLVGDLFREEFEVRNNHFLPVLWAELADYSRFPSSQAGQVVACGGNNAYRWRREVPCDLRGVYRLGPYGLTMGDPFGLFQVSRFYAKEEYIVIYPRVVSLPHRRFPHGQSTGTDRRRRSVLGVTPAYSVLEYQPGDSLRRIHWRVTAHRGRLMVRELETEPTGDIWIVLDLFGDAQSGDGPLGTFEFGITVAASMAAALLAGNEGRAVGLLAHSGAPEEHQFPVLEEGIFGNLSPLQAGGAVTVRPKAGPAQLWQILTALAPVERGSVPLAQVLAGSRELFGPRSTLLVITPHMMSVGQVDALEVDRVAEVDGGNRNAENSTSSDSSALGIQNGAGEDKGPPVDWPAQLLHLRTSGYDGHAMLITPHESALDEDVDLAGLELSAGKLQEMLLGQRIQTDCLAASDAYVPVVTHRRRKTVVRSTPSGGVATYEMDEEIG